MKVVPAVWTGLFGLFTLRSGFAIRASRALQSEIHPWRP